ncbi:uncharacterized protein [Drosophila suzukii]|uniref:Uncharacterized protein n=1 Tax=Drosophila suzukii TaxID=28584 RepID=A0AB40D7K2_DROSZ
MLAPDFSKDCDKYLLTFFGSFISFALISTHLLGDNNNHDSQLDEEVAKENQPHGRDRNLSGNSKCRRDLFPSKCDDPVPPPEQLYSYVYAAAASLGQCVQPQVCSALLRALHSEQLGYLASSYRSGAGQSNATTTSTCTIASATGSSITSRRPLQPANAIYPTPYRTGSHFGFNSPRQQPRTEHKHVPKEREQQGMGYRPMQRGISYEEIFATPRYEQLCQACFDKLLRLKPELQRIGSGTAPSSCAEELTSAGSTPIQGRPLPSLPEYYDNVGEMAVLPERPRRQRNAETQTKACSASSSTINFLSQIERFNFSEESTNVNYSPGPFNSDISLIGLVMEQATSSAGASATSAAPQRIYHGEQGDVTEVWSFGRWLEPQDKMIASNANEFAQQPLTEHRITLEITENFPSGHPTSSEHVDRQLMSREERQRRKSEFQELWQDHVEYFEARDQIHHEQETLDEQEARSSSRANYLLGEDQQMEQSEDQGEVDRGHTQDETLTEPSDELPKILQKFEESLTLAGENLEKLVATTKQLKAMETDTSIATSSSPPVERESGNSSPLFRSISLDNIPEADDTVSIQEPDSVLPTNPNNSNCSEEDVNGIPNNLEQEEKRDDEKPVTPIEPERPSDKENDGGNEKDIDENDLEVETVLEVVNGEPTEVPNLETDNLFFTPLEREILQRIEDERLDESEPIFGKIDHSIRNKMTPKKLRDLVSEEIFRTCTHVYPNPSTPLSKDAPPADTTLTPSGFSLSAHNISAPCSSMAHTHLVTRPTPRMSRSWSEDREKGEQEEQGMTDEETPLERIISSTTFVCRSSPRRKRNFIQENIRNASRPRSAAGSVKKHRSNKVSTPKAISSPSSVFAFQCGQRDSGARLWVSLPTPPRGASGQKRDNPTSPARALYTVRGSLSSPFAKRRKPLVVLPPLRRPHREHNQSQNPELSASNLSLHRTLSSRTFFVPDEEDGNSDNVSTSTFQMEGSQEELLLDKVWSQEELQMDNDRSQQESPKAQDKANATNSSMYYSANDKSQEGESSQESAEAIEEELRDMQFRPNHLQDFSERPFLLHSSSDKSLEIPKKTNDHKEDSSSQNVEIEVTNGSTHEISPSQVTTDSESLDSKRIEINDNLSPAETSSQLDEDSSSIKPTRLAGGLEALQSPKSSTGSDHIDCRESTPDDIRNQGRNISENVLSSENELNGIEKQNAESYSDDRDEQLNIVEKANDKNMSDDEVTLDTVCNVRGLELCVQEVVPIKQEDLEEINDFGGMFEDGFVPVEEADEDHF